MKYFIYSKFAPNTARYVSETKIRGPSCARLTVSPVLSLLFALLWSKLHSDMALLTGTSRYSRATSATRENLRDAWAEYLSEDVFLG